MRGYAVSSKGEGMSHVREALPVPAPADGGGCDAALSSSRRSSVCSLSVGEGEGERARMEEDSSFRTDRQIYGLRSARARVRAKQQEEVNATTDGARIFPLNQSVL